MTMPPRDDDCKTEQDAWFDVAARLTREQYSGESAREQTTERLLRSGSRARPRRSWPLLLLPLFAVLGGSLAWGAELQTSLNWAAQRALALFASHDEAPPAQHSALAQAALSEQHAAQSAAPPVEAVPTSPALTGSVTAESEPEVRTAPPRQRPPVTISEPAASVSAEPIAPAPPNTTTDLELYRSAHEAHFVRRDWAAALAGWDRYLAEVSKGRFAPEARFNRAVALAELGRNEAAIAAFEPFARGDYGGYHQAEAVRRIAQLRR